MLTALLKWQNQDSTQDLNARFKTIFNKGVVSGGAINPIPLTLTVSVSPFSAMSIEGLLVVEDGSPLTALTIPAGQTSVVSVRVQYQVGDPVLIQYFVTELSAFNVLPDQDLHVVIGMLIVPSLATQILNSYISYDIRDEVDRLGRSAFRGRVARTVFSITGATTTASETVTGIASTAGIAVGADYSGPGIQPNTLVQTILSPTSLKLSTPATATQAATLSTTGNTLSGSALITNIPSTVGIVAGQTVSMASVPVGATVLSVDSGSQVTISVTAFSTQSNIAVTFSAVFVLAPVLPYTDNRPGDFYMVNDGTGDIPELFGWDGTNWNNLTSVIALATDLAAHRANLFSNEKHMTDNEQDAALGSMGTPSLSNRYVTEQDTRLPSQTENDALVGSDDTPSSTNKYITQAYPVAAATELPLLPPGGPISLTAINGPYYVGKNGIGTANKFFMILDSVENRAFSNAFKLSPTVTGVFTDFLLTSPLNPSADVNVDANGFYTGSLFLQTSTIIDAPFRLLYGREQTLKTVLREFTLRSTPGVETAGSSVVQSIINIKGRPYDGVNSIVPDREQNINLRATLDGVQSYLGSVLDANVVADDGDYTRLQAEPVIGDSFVKNVGIAPVYIFHNIGQIGINSTAYDPTNGRITYNSAVVLTSVQSGDLWFDGALNSYRVNAVNTISFTIDLRDLATGAIPAAVISFPNGANTQFGSVTQNSNPRGLLLSEMKLNALSEMILFNDIQEVEGQFSQPQQYRTFGVMTPAGRIEPRTQLYGSWQSSVDNNLTTVISNPGQGGLISTGFFTSIALLIKRRALGPPLSVSINERSPTIISSSYTGQAAELTLGGQTFQALTVATGLSLANPTTVRVDISTATAAALEVYGIQYIYNDTNALLETGVAFNNADLVIRDTQDTIALPTAAQFKRGGVYSYALTSGGFSFGNTFLTETDQSQVAWGATVAGSIITINTDSGNLRFNYKIGDLVELFDGSTNKVIRKIASLNYTIPATFTLDSSPGITGSVIIRHAGSTDSSVVSTREEEEVVTYDLVNDLGGLSATDFRTVGTADRYCVAPDGISVFAGQALSVQTASITGADAGVNITASGALRISTLCTRIDLVTSNTANTTTVGVKIDNSPSYTLTVAGGAARRTTILLNARHQSHEIEITDSSGVLIISKVIIHQPKKPTIAGLPTKTSDLVYTATYIPSDDGVPSTLTALSTFRYMPRGGVYYPAGSYMSFNKNSGSWLSAIDWTRAYWGPAIQTTTVGAFAEFSFYGTAFELVYLVGPDSGTFSIAIDGAAFNATGNLISTSFASVAGSNVNGNAASLGRRIVGRSGLTLGWHTVTMTLVSTRMGFEGHYTASMSGTSSLQVAGYSPTGQVVGVSDVRKFLAIDPVKPGFEYVRKDIVPYPDGKVNVGTAESAFGTTYTQSLGYTRQMMTFDATNTQARWLASNGSYYSQSAGLFSATLNNNTTGSVWTQSTTLANHWVVFYSIVRGASSSTGQLFVATNGVVASVADVGSATSATGITFSASFLAGNVTLSYTSSNTGSAAAMEYFFFRWT